MTDGEYEDLIEDEDDVVIPELSDEVLEKPEEPPKDDAKEHLLDEFPEVEFDEDEPSLDGVKRRKLPVKAVLKGIPLGKIFKRTKSDVGAMLPDAERPPNPATGDVLGQAESQASPAAGSAPSPQLVPGQAPSIALDERVIGETQSFEEYNSFQKNEATASDLESLVMLERAIAKGEQRRVGDTNVMKWVSAIAMIMIVGVIAAYMAMDLGLLDFLK